MASATERKTHTAMTLVLHITLWTLTGAAALLAAWALFHDRARGRERCPKCWHDMAGLEGRLVCPECGRNARKARRLSKTRRRWRIAIPCLLAAILFPTWLRPAIDRRDEGWSALLPTTGLIVAYRWTPKRDHFVNDTLFARRADLREWQIRMMGAWVAPINRSTARKAILYRDVWFRDEPIPIGCRDPWDLSVAHYWLRIEALDDRGELVVENKQLGLHWDTHLVGMITPESHYGQGTLPADSGAMASESLVVRMVSLWGRGLRGGEMLWEGDLRVDRTSRVNRTSEHVISLRVKLIDRESEDAYDKIVTPISGADIDRFVRNTARLRLVRSAYGDARISPREIYEDDGHADIAFCFELEILDGEDVVWHETCFNGVLLWPGADVHFGSFGKGFLEQILDKEQQLIDPGDLKIRLRSRPDLAIYCLEYDRYWKGEITLPFLELFENQHPDYTVVGE